VLATSYNCDNDAHSTLAIAAHACQNTVQVALMWLLWLQAEPADMLPPLAGKAAAQHGVTANGRLNGFGPASRAKQLHKCANTLVYCIPREAPCSMGIAA